MQPDYQARGIIHAYDLDDARWEDVPGWDQYILIPAATLYDVPTAPGPEPRQDVVMLSPHATRALIARLTELVNERMCLDDTCIEIVPENPNVVGARGWYCPEHADRINAFGLSQRGGE